MRCPKCQYISFDSGDRCRNCGYEFALVVDEPSVDVTIRRDEPAPGRIRDGSLEALDTPLSPVLHGDLERDHLFDAGRRLPTASDLPLFTERVADDQAPLVTPPAVPRPPLSVRRAHPSARGRLRSPGPEELSLDLSSEPDEGAEVDPESEDRSGDDASRAAGVVRRVAAGVLDTGVLGAIEATVVYLTLRLCGLTADQWRVLPVVPLGAFLLLLCGGYFVLFTAAGGQTIGKMVTRIRVVAASPPDDSPTRVSFGMALLRAVACLGSVVALGAGFLPMLFSADRRAFHDRIAETRVVSA